MRAEPDEIEVGKMAEVYIFADENSEFWERKILLGNNLYSNSKWRSNYNWSVWNRMQIRKIWNWIGTVC